MRMCWIKNSSQVIAGFWLTGSLGIALASGPTPPADLRIDAYSSTTVEIFWSRSYDDLAVKGYELLRNGQTLWLGDVTSYLDKNVNSQATVNYNIVAMDFDNNRSARSATLTFSNQNGNGSSCTGTSSCSSSSVSISAEPSNPTPGHTPDAVTASGNQLPGPTRIRGDVYSDTALELFWDAADSPQGIKGYDVYRNGDWLGRPEGTSFFDAGLSPGTQYHYTVYSIGRDNQVSDSFAGIDMRTTGQSTSGSGSTAASSVSHTDSSGGNLVGSVWGDTYSTRAAEIFWDYTGSDAITLFEVVRNGAIVSQTSGRSYYDESLSANSEYRFEIRALSGGTSRMLGTVDLKTPALW